MKVINMKDILLKYETFGLGIKKNDKTTTPNPEIMNK
jgi:hypothetical protein